jgi:hypothetical protein
MDVPEMSFSPVLYRRLEKLESKVSDHDETLHPGRYDRD